MRKFFKETSRLLLQIILLFLVVILVSKYIQSLTPSINSFLIYVLEDLSVGGIKFIEMTVSAIAIEEFFRRIIMHLKIWTTFWWCMLLIGIIASTKGLSMLKENKILKNNYIV